MSELVNYQDEVPVQRSLACQGYRQHPALFRPGVCNADRVAGRGHAGLSPEQVRQFIKGVMAVFAQVSGEDGGATAETKNKPLKG